jgi:hypothetical protein
MVLLWRWKLWQAEFYRQPYKKATLHQFEEGMCSLFQEPQCNNGREFAAWYMKTN